MEINTKDLVREELNKLKENPRFFEMDKVLQHGSTTVLEHSIKVAYLSLAIVRKYRLKVDYKSLIRGALLHDYFLYNRKDNIHEGFHAFTHGKTAVNNAKKDYEINKIEEDIILRHMFPLTITPPKYKESWIVCLADTLSATKEFALGGKEKIFTIFNRIKEVQ